MYFYTFLSGKDEDLEKVTLILECCVDVPLKAYLKPLCLMHKVANMWVKMRVVTNSYRSGDFL